MWALLFIGSSQYQPHATPTPEIQTRVQESSHRAVASQPQKVQNQATDLTFSKDMSNEQLALWLTHHPNLIATDFSEDIDKLKGTNFFFYTTLNDG